MELIKIYECLCDPTRLRILNLLCTGPLCVCHIQEILEEPQVKVSRHLQYLRTRGLVKVRREANWMIYSLPPKRPRELELNLACLQDCSREEPLLKHDLAQLRKVRERLAADPSKAAEALCCAETKTVGLSR